MTQEALPTNRPLAAVSGDRRLILRRPNTGETCSIVFAHGPEYDVEALGRLDWFMRDRHADTSVTHPIELYELMHRLQLETGARELVITSGYRTLGTNDWLRRQGHDTARNSYHIRGMAVDLAIPKLDTKELGGIAHRCGAGDVGLYPGFCHCDVGPARSWRNGV